MENNFCKKIVQIKSNTSDGCYSINDVHNSCNQICHIFKRPCHVRHSPCLSTINKCHACLPFARPFHPQQSNFKCCRYFSVNNPCMTSFVRPPEFSRVFLANSSTERQSYYNSKPIERLNGDGIKVNSSRISKNILTNGKTDRDYGNNILTSNIPECIANGSDFKSDRNLRENSKSSRHGASVTQTTGSYLNRGTSLQGGIGSVNIHGDIFKENLQLETGRLQGSGIRTSKGNSRRSNLPTGTIGLLNREIGTQGGCQINHIGNSSETTVPNYGVCEKSKDSMKIDLGNKNAQEYYISTNWDKVEKIDILNKIEIIENEVPVTCKQTLNEGNSDRPAVLLSEMERRGEETKDINCTLPVPIVDESKIPKGKNFSDKLSQSSDKKCKDNLKGSFKSAKSKQNKKVGDFMFGNSAKSDRYLITPGPFRNKLPNKPPDNKNVRNIRIRGSLLLSKSNISNQFVGNYRKKLINTICNNTGYCHLSSCPNIDNCKTNTFLTSPNSYISCPNPYLSNSKPCLSSSKFCLSNPNPCVSNPNPCVSNPNSYTCYPIQNSCQSMLCGLDRC